jgi:hypothetical protein
MKRIVILVILVSLVIMLTGCDIPESGRSIADKASDDASLKASIAVPIPVVSYFQEKRTIAKWAQRWDKANVVTYVYLFNFGNCIGYYVCLGKPASTRSYLTPEDKIENHLGNLFVIGAPDIDGTYGDNNPGIRFFTAEGTAVEWAGSGATYLYSDAPLPLSVPKLNK